MKKSLHFLLIDDDKNFGKIISKLATKQLVSLDHIERLEDLEDAKNLEKYDVAIIDYDLEKTTGFEIAEVLYRFCPDLPIILTSNTNRPYQDARCKLPNLIGFVSKWAHPKKFLEEVHEIAAQPEGIAHEESKMEGAITTWMSL